MCSLSLYLSGDSLSNNNEQVSPYGQMPAEGQAMGCPLAGCPRGPDLPVPQRGRWGEATGLRVKHLDMPKRWLMIEENAVQVGSVIEVGTPKNHKKRTVPFPRFLSEPLARQCEGKGREDLVFPGDNGHHLRLATVHEDNMSWFASAVKRSDLPSTPHDLRHSAASFAVSAGANVKAVQKMLGHASAAMSLDVYADLFDGDLDSVSDALDLAVSPSGVLKMCSKP